VYAKERESPMDDKSPAPADEQAELWNGPAGQAWIAAQDVLDRMYRRFEDLLVAEVAGHRDARVLDVGCGTGSTTIAIARAQGASGACVGIDLSAPMIDVARASAARAGSRATFVCASAQTYAFEPASFDRMLSRFGVMFFDDPVAAFAVLRRAARPGAEARFVAWRRPEENDFMTAAERAAAPFLPDLPARRTDAPGQFALAEPRRVERLFTEAGWRDVDLQPLDVPCTFPESHLVDYLGRLGPVGRQLHQLDDETRTRALRTMRAAFEPFVHGTEVTFTAACWMIGARR
jgi:SAM-dependent methyltransferase